MGRHRTRRQPVGAAAVAVAVACGVLALAPAASAGWVTGIQYGLENWVTYPYTPTSTGTLTIEIFWVDEEGTASTFPRSEVDVVVQGYDPATGESYAQLPVVVPMWSWPQNPITVSVYVTGDMVGKSMYMGVAPWLGDCQYGIRAWFKGAPVIDQTGTAYGHGGELFLPPTANGGAWHSVLQYWPHSHANWDDCAWEVDPYGPGTLADDWSVQYSPPVVTDTPVSNTGHNGYSGRWYLVAPWICTGAEVPNVFVRAGIDLYPRPGTLACNAAPLWYTWAYSDTAAADAPAYQWANVATTSASGHCWCNTSSSTAKLIFRFYGPEVTWVYTTGPKGGIQKVTIDGTQVGTVDQYSATAAYKVTRTFSGLSNAPHTLVVESTRTKNPASGGFFIYHDCFMAPGYAGDPQPYNENNSDGMTRYVFGKVNNASASGGTFAFDKSAQAPIAFTFSGTSITWKYVTGPKGGIQRVWIDGVDKGTVDQYSATVTYQKTTTFSGLAPGVHTILIKGSGSKNAASTGYFIYHDAFIVGSQTVED